MDHEARAEEADAEAGDEEPLVAVDEAHREARADAEDGERDGLRLGEVVEVDEGPWLDDVDEGVEVGERDVERDLNNQVCQR